MHAIETADSDSENPSENGGEVVADQEDGVYYYVLEMRM